VLLDKNKEATSIFIYSFIKSKNSVKELEGIFNREQDKNYRGFFSIYRATIL